MSLHAPFIYPLLSFTAHQLYIIVHLFVDNNNEAMAVQQYHLSSFDILGGSDPNSNQTPKHCKTNTWMKVKLLHNYHYHPINKMM